MTLPAMKASTSTKAFLKNAIGWLPSSSTTSCFSTSSTALAAKKQPKKTQQKKKTAIRKSAGASGPRSPGGKRSGRSAGDASSAASRANPFVKPPADMSSLPLLVPEHASESNLYKTLAWSQKTLEATRIQGFGLTREMARELKMQPRPRTLLRPQSLQLFDHLDSKASTASSSSSSAETTLLQGPLGSGASTLLLQAVSYALESSWLVLYIPRGINLVDSSSPYAYSGNIKTYLQPLLVRNLFSKLLSINADVLSSITLDAPIQVERGPKLEAGTNLAEAARRALQDSTPGQGVHQIFDVVLRRIVNQKQVPVLVAIDGLQAYFSKTKYRDPDFRPLESYELALPRSILAAIRTSGEGAFGGVQRGVTLGALSLQHTEWPAPVELQRAIMKDSSVGGLHTRVDEIHERHASESNIVTHAIGAGINRLEAAGLFDAVRNEGGTWSELNDEFFIAKLVESGGNAGVFERSLRTSAL